MKEYNIASISGDGIGKEVVPEGIKILKEAAQKHQFKINFTSCFKIFSICLGSGFFPYNPLE